MESINIFKNLSPLDHRYLLANRALFERLQTCLSEEANVSYCIRAEIALLTSHIHFSFQDDEALLSAVRAAADEISADEVYAEEEKTSHNIRALVNVLQIKVPERLIPFVHLGATSVDILDTAFSMRLRDAVRSVVLPLLIDLESGLISLAGKEAETSQVGRTHGQFAVPITFGFAMSEYVSRLGKCIVGIERFSNDLRGKLAGAVGAYNATSMIVADPLALEAHYLGQLGLKPSETATQIVEPEYALRLLQEINVAFGVMANLADDLRNLQRSEIDEVRESFGSGQVGSSTMPQKRNPWNSEHVKSLWKAFAPRVMTFYMDQISEHQRDLTNSASGRFVADYIAGFTAAAERLRRVVSSLDIRRERMLQNPRSGGGGVLAEPAYILLALEGVGDAHEVLRKATLAVEKNRTSLIDELRRDEKVWERIKKRLSEISGIDADTFFSAPENYRGLAARRAVAVAEEYSKIMENLKEMIE